MGFFSAYKKKKMTEKKFILTVDFGSTTLTATVFDLETNIVAFASNMVFLYYIPLSLKMLF